MNVFRGFGWPLSVVVVLASVAPAPVLASGELHLAWDDCRLGFAGDSDLQSVCLLNEGESKLYCSFVLDAPLDDVLGIEVVVDLQHSAGVLPDWWHLQGKGECRDGTLSVRGDYTLESVCTDPWQNLGGGVVTYERGLPRGQPSQARIFGTYAVPSSSARSLDAGLMYYGLTIVIRNDRSVFPFECAGCSQPACLVLNQVTLLRSPAAKPPEIPVVRPGSDGANRVTWKGGSNADCTAVPVRRSTWGQVRNLYR
jgi:hypothetical protein